MISSHNRLYKYIIRVRNKRIIKLLFYNWNLQNLIFSKATYISLYFNIASLKEIELDWFRTSKKKKKKIV